MEIEDTASCVVCEAERPGRPVNPRPTETIQGHIVHKSCASRARYLLSSWTAILDGGAYRWPSNGHVVPADCLRLAVALGLADPGHTGSSAAVRDQETRAFMAQYRANQRPATAAEIVEMRAAFGEGTTVVDVISGRTTRV